MSLNFFPYEQGYKIKWGSVGGFGDGWGKREKGVCGYKYSVESLQQGRDSNSDCQLGQLSFTNHVRLSTYCYFDKKMISTLVKKGSKISSCFE